MMCSNCGLWNPKSAMWCDCDYEFLSHRVVNHTLYAATAGPECGACELINVPGAIWCLCGADLRVHRVVRRQISPTSSSESPALSTLIDGVLMWMPFLLTLIFTISLAFTVWIALLLVQIVLVSYDGHTIGTRIAVKSNWAIDLTVGRLPAISAIRPAASAIHFAFLARRAVRL